MRTRVGGVLTGAVIGVALSGAALADPNCRNCVFGLQGLLAEGTSLSFTYDYENQDRNWSGTRRAPAADNTDKRIRDEYFVPSLQLPLGRDWQAQISLPVVDRLFVTDENGPRESFRHTGFGDLQLAASYSGLLRSGALGLVFGITLPTGDVGYSGFPGDMQIGTGSTALLLGLTYDGALGGDWTWSSEFHWNKPFAGSHRFKPGSETGGALTLAYGGFGIEAVRLTPSLQLAAANVTRDAGPDADGPNSGFSRIVLSPGLQASLGGWSLAGEVAIPVYQYRRGNQLVVRREIKIVLSYALGGGET